MRELIHALPSLALICCASAPNSSSSVEAPPTKRPAAPPAFDCPPMPPANCVDQYHYVRNCPAAKLPAAMHKVGIGLHPRKRVPDTEVTLQLSQTATTPLLRQLRAFGAVNISAYGTIVFADISPEAVLCIARRPWVRHIRVQARLVPMR